MPSLDLDICVFLGFKIINLAKNIYFICSIYYIFKVNLFRLYVVCVVHCLFQVQYYVHHAIVCILHRKTS